MDPIEMAGFATGIIGVWLTIKQNVWCFPTGLINVMLSFYLFITQHLYSDAVQQLCYVVLLSYGWYNWKRTNANASLHVTVLSNKEKIGYLFSAALIAITMGSIFTYFTDAHLPYLDASATAMSLVAQFLIAKKKIENWILWIVVNVMYIGIYLFKDLYLYAVLFAIYLALAVNGFLVWKKEINTQHAIKG